MADGSQSPPKRKAGRPSDFDPELAEEICERIADGDSLRKITAQREMPDLRTVRRWLLKGELEPSSPFGLFRLQYARAREEQAEVYAERILEEAETAEDAALGRLRVDALKWTASKLAPKKFGDKILHAGADGGAIQVERKPVIDLSLYSPEERETLRVLLEIGRERMLQRQLAAPDGQVIEGECRDVSEG